jgi:SAM-dependent methyltransferase
MTPAPTYRPCPSCDGTASTILDAYSPDPWEVAACDGCDFTYLRNPPAYEALEEDYAWEKTYAEKKTKSKGSTSLSPAIRNLRGKLGLTQRSQHENFRKWFNDGHVIDIGCGDAGLIQPPMTGYGIELSTALHKKADKSMRAKGGFCVKGAGAEAIYDFDEGSFDGVVMNSYLEHETAVAKVLNGAYRALKSTGAVFVRVPNFASLNRKVIGAKWCGFRYPDHVNYFTLDSLTKIAAKAGFTTELVNKYALHIDDNIKVVLRKDPTFTLSNSSTQGA